MRRGIVQHSIKRPKVDISVMLTPISVILTPLTKNGSKNLEHDRFTVFFLGFLLSIQFDGKCVPSDPKLHLQ